jgi:hypothetical protein
MDVANIHPELNFGGCNINPLQHHILPNVFVSLDAVLYLLVHLKSWP